MADKNIAVRLAMLVLKDTVHGLLSSHPVGLGNSAIARELGLESDHEGAQKDYLTYSLLGLMLKEGRVRKIKDTQNGHNLYVATN